MEAYRDQYASLFKGGRDVVLLAISSEPPEALESWARDADFPFLFGSDPGSEAREAFGAGGRSLFVVDPQGRVAYRALPFREVDPTAYEELGRAIDRILGSAGDADEESDARR
jgi:peroxiredoxin Q/BCP